MQGGEPGIEPGVGHQRRKAIDALQQQGPIACLGDHRGVLGAARGAASEAIACQGVLQGAGGQFGGAAPAGHRCAPIWAHGLQLAEAGHEAPIHGLLPAPQQRAGAQGPWTPEGHRLGPGLAAVAQQLQRPALGPPGPQLAARHHCRQVVGQGLGAAHSPDTGGGPGPAGDHAAVAAGEQPWLSPYLQAGLSEQAPLAVAGQA